MFSFFSSKQEPPPPIRSTSATADYYQIYIKELQENYDGKQKPEEIYVQKIEDTRNESERALDDFFYLMPKRSANAWEESYFVKSVTPTKEKIEKSFHEMNKVLRNGILWF